jgi:nickel/cobalt transporter (NicO) family protein
MIRIAAITTALVLATSTAAGAHRLDEYLQATRIAVSAEGLVVHLDLTPGVSVASEIIALLDTNADGRVSPLEAEAYGRVALADVSAGFDGTSIILTLMRVEVPTEAELRDGVGTIRIAAAATTNAGGAGPHQFELRNSHRPEGSVYLANALAPEASEIRIVRQRRDPRQQTFRLDYEVRPSRGAAAGWLIAAAAAMMLHAGWRTRPRRRTFRETS